MSIRQTLLTVHEALEAAGIEHALIGGMALATHGINRATDDVDILIDECDKEKLLGCLTEKRFVVRAQTSEVIHLEGIGKLDVLLARRPMSRKMLANAKKFPQHGIKCLDVEDIIGLKIQAFVNDPKRELQDKADIQSLTRVSPNVDWNRIKQYADLFDKWPEIEGLK